MALEPIDYTTHSHDIEEQYLKVVRGNDQDTTWLIISPNSSKEYAPELTGNSFTDFLNSFDDTKVQFGIARVSPPNSDVYKNILVGWCPDSASMKQRASFASNFSSIANNVFQGYHIQVTARDTDDLDENDLLKQVSNAAGARYSIQTSNVSSSSSSSTGATKSVVRKFTPSANTSTPKPVVNSPIKKNDDSKDTGKGTDNNDDDDDWDEPEIKERDFDKDPIKQQPSSYKPIGKIDLQKVIKEENAKPDPRLISQTDDIVKSSNTTKIDPLKDINELKNKSKQQRNWEMDNLLNKQTMDLQKDKVIKGFKTEKSPAQLWAEKKAAESKAGSETKNENKQFDNNKNNNEEEEEEEEHDINELKSKFEKMNNVDEPQIIKPKHVLPPRNETVSETTTPSKDFKKIGQPLPGLTKETNSDDNNSDNDDWSDGDDSAAGTTEQAPILPSRNVPIEKESHIVPEPESEEEQEEEEEDAHALPTRQSEPQPDEEEISSEPQPEPESEEEQDEEQEQEEQEQEVPALPSRQQETRYVPPPPPRRVVEPEPEKKAPSAIAEYDYEAGEDNELTFNENDKIINIEFVDDDWWLGELEKNGSKGLFPSNYVSLVD